MPPDGALDFPDGVFPYGVAVHDGRRRLVVAVDTRLLDLSEAATAMSGHVDPALLTTGRLDELLAAGRPVWSAVRAAIADHVENGTLDRFLHDRQGWRMVLPWSVGDFVDFYSSLEHAANVGRMFRPGRETLYPNWRHMPVGYHGRGGSVMVDGTPVRRPSGQRLVDGTVEFGPSTRLDFEAELGWILGGGTEPGRPVPPEDVADHLFGVVLLDDWSARDLQAWETVPLGPFLSKSFATSVSAWVVPLEALEPARLANPPQDPPPLPYLRVDAPWSFDIDVEAWLRPAGRADEHRIAHVNAGRCLYWNAAQQLVHLTSNGSPVRPGDLLGSGTISGPGREERGSLLELSWNGTEPLLVTDGVERTFLEDGDVLSLRASFPTASGISPLGPASGEILAAHH